MRILQIIYRFIIRFLALIPAFLTDPFDFIERQTTMTYDPPLWIFWLLLSLGILLVGYLTYRDLWKKYKVAWEVYDHLVELLRELTQTNDSKSRSEIYIKIEYERRRLPDKNLMRL